MSIFSGITARTKLGGIFGLSCYLLLHNKLKDFVPADSPNKDTPIFMGHGDSDPLVRPQWGMMTAQLLKEAGWNVDLKMYSWVSRVEWYIAIADNVLSGLEHSAVPEEIDDVEKYLNARIPPVGDKQSL
jgi:acetyl esterase/lipase